MLSYLILCYFLFFISINVDFRCMSPSIGRQRNYLNSHSADVDCVQDNFTSFQTGSQIIHYVCAYECEHCQKRN
uniref:U33-Deinotoxin-Dsu1a_1 n=1 Tax=Deinopis subrufa TaxID=1905329 RepID=A0A4V2H9V2_DEISU